MPATDPACGDVTGLNAVHPAAGTAVDVSAMIDMVSAPTTASDSHAFICGICLTPLEATIREKLECGHSFCQGCIANVVVTCLETGYIPARCPEQRCPAHITPAEADGLVSPGLSLRYRRLVSLRVSRDARACPRYDIACA